MKFGVNQCDNAAMGRSVVVVFPFVSGLIIADHYCFGNVYVYFISAGTLRKSSISVWRRLPLYSAAAG